MAMTFFRLAVVMEWSSEWSQIVNYFCGCLCARFSYGHLAISILPCDDNTFFEIIKSCRVKVFSFPPPPPPLWVNSQHPRFQSSWPLQWSSRKNVKSTENVLILWRTWTSQTNCSARLLVRLCNFGLQFVQFNNYSTSSSRTITWAGSQRGAERRVGYQLITTRANGIVLLYTNH